MKEKEKVSSLRPQKRTDGRAKVFNPGNQAVVNLTKEAQGTMHYKAQR